MYKMKKMISTKNGLLALLLLVAQISFAQEDNYNWQDLFNGKDLNGWKKLNGTAKYMIDGDAIVGISELNTPNTFLATEKMYTDFILEVDLKVDNLLNSGIQIRSNSLDSYRDGRVHGYQVEIDPSKRAYSGGVYDEARRGWLYPLARNPKGRAAFRTGEWNHYRIECIGSHIRTWVNGVMCSNLVDDKTAEGFIALQVHGIRDEEQAGTKVMWKNIKLLTEDLEAARWKADPEVPEISYLHNTLTKHEEREGWRLLWDGKSSNGWRGAKLDGFPESGWQIEDGTLTVLATDGGESTGPGDIITTDQFSEFELELEFNITEGANSGIKYFVDPTLNKGTGSAIGLEFQILDDKKHPDAKKGVKGNRTLGSLYDLIRADNLSVSGRKKTFKGVGSWNKARIVVKGNYVEHWLNNEKVVEFERGSQIFRALVAYSKYKDWPQFGEYPQGPILLQDHGDTVHYRNIKIREF